ncbi:hypothetical protein EYC98_10425 [Halieaceae bacterium IMCC14734]|uniref:AMIN domain-containing protein n=1 Tax=Candidatus Litorirhabdus singularis TaxID=2518993 RepID=A0ABT3TG55_9GAMM|nr:DUF1302 family protein [Candidatus Litorirhabdus singularis]MCX2981278.1 hypothetical protein [Candidatus Litorirhabdus singularis]
MRYFKALLLIFGLSCSALSFGQVLEALRLSSAEEKTRLVLDLSALPSYSIDRTTDPAQLLIDIEATSLGDSIVLPELTGSALNNIALQTQDSAVHVILDLVQPELVIDDFLLGPHLLRGNRLVLDFYPARPTSIAPLAAPAVVVEKVPEKNQNVVTEVPSESSLPAESTDEIAARAPAKASWPFTFSGTWEQEWAGYTDDGDSQKFEATIEPRVDLELPSGASITTIFRVRLDTVGDIGPEASRPDNYSTINGPFYNDAHAELSLREMYLDAEWGDNFWRIGKQQVVWGQADGIKVLDVVNPQSYREFILDDFDDSRIPLTMLNLEIPLANDSTLQLLWIPDTTYHELAEADTPYFLTSPKLVPQPVPGLETRVDKANKPDDFLEDSEAGLRYSSFWGGWDVTLNYLYHYQDFPVLYQQLEKTATGVEMLITPEYERNHLFGGTLSNSIGTDLILRAEIAYNSDSFHVSSAIDEQGIGRSAEVSGVVGLDWQLTSSTLLSGQYFQSSLLDYEPSIQREESERNISAYLQQFFLNETLQFSGLLLYSTDTEDTWAQVKLKYMLQSNLEIWLGADVFSGDEEGLFGQFEDTDRILVGLEWGF